jgi:hypothetical protein
MSTVTMPSSPVPSKTEWSFRNANAANTSPFSFQQQVQQWGAGLIEVSITIPPMTGAQAAAWVGFLGGCQGIVNTFLFGDPAKTTPNGSGAGTPVVSGAGQSGFSLNTSGWTPNANGVLQPGDWIMLNGNRLYCATAVVNADASGLAAVPIFPNLREAPSGSLTLVNAKGTFRLKNIDQRFTIDEARVYGVTFEIREAI